MASDEQFRSKVSQYPPGTTFRVVPFANEERIPGLKQARETAERGVRAAGYKIAP
jgi:hypothetical protein